MSKKVKCVDNNGFKELIIGETYWVHREYYDPLPPVVWCLILFKDDVYYRVPEWASGILLEEVKDNA